MRPAFLMCAFLLPLSYVAASLLNRHLTDEPLLLRLLAGMVPLPLCVVLALLGAEPWRRLRWTDSEPAIGWGFGRPTWAMFRDALAALGLVVVTVPILTGLTYLLMHGLGGDTHGPQLADLFLKAPTSSIVMIFFFAVIVAPLTEELLFRRIIFSFMASYFGVWPSLICVATLFAFFHDATVQYLGLFLLAAILQILYLRHRSLWPSVMLHAMNNGLMLALLLFCRLTHLIPPDWM